jgi:hypothetical protein
MDLNAMVNINARIDLNLSRRRSCREGIFGSCAIHPPTISVFDGRGSIEVDRTMHCHIGRASTTAHDRPRQAEWAASEDRSRCLAASHPRGLH